MVLQSKTRLIQRQKKTSTWPNAGDKKAAKYPTNIENITNVLVKSVQYESRNLFKYFTKSLQWDCFCSQLPAS